MKHKTLACIITALSLCGISHAQTGGSSELRASKEATVLDLKMWGKITDHNNIFFRNINTVDYEGTANAFTLFDIDQKIYKGFGAVIETQFYGNKMFIKAGPQIALNQEYANFSSALLIGQKDHELNIFANYKRNKININLEIFTKFTKEMNYASTVGRLNTGINISPNIVCGVYNQGSISRSDASKYQIGAYIKVNY